MCYIFVSSVCGAYEIVIEKYSSFVKSLKVKEKNAKLSLTMT
jgi:hypothetical protein